MMGPGLRWALAYAAALGGSLAGALRSDALGDAAFVLGALLILSSIFFIGVGGERRHRVVRGLLGAPIAHDPIEPQKRQRQISTGVKVFLLGLALWAPLLVLALR